MGNNLGMPFLVSLLMPWAVKKLDTSAMQVKMHQEMLAQAPAVGIITTPSDGLTDWLRVGEIYQEMAIMAEKEGMTTAILAAPIEMSNYYQELQKVLVTDWRPQLFFRIGYPTKIFPRAPRWPLAKFLIPNF